MSLVVLAPLAVLLAALGATTWFAARLTRSVHLVQRELAVLARLAEARELLVTDLERTRSAFGRTRPVGSDAWARGRRR